MSFFHQNKKREKTGKTDFLDEDPEVSEVSVDDPAIDIGQNGSQHEMDLQQVFPEAYDPRDGKVSRRSGGISSPSSRKVHKTDETPTIHLEGIVKKFYVGTENEIEVLHDISLDVYKGEFTAIVGESGSGKSTLMNIIGLLDRPTGGQYQLVGKDVSRLKDNALSRIRNRQIGFVFQTYNLIPRTTALKNVEMPMMYARIPQEERTRRAKELLSKVGMSDRMTHKPDELSGGQKQRVAIARAMANDPAIILADEPTGALDSATGRQVMDLFHELHDEEGKTILLITHSKPLSEECGRILTLLDGRIVDERRGKLAHS